MNCHKPLVPCLVSLLHGSSLSKKQPHIIKFYKLCTKNSRN